MTILDDILAYKRGVVAAAQAAVPLSQLRAQANDQAPARGFARALRASKEATAPRLIAEIKKVSPAKGALNPEMDVVAMARSYEAAGASAISVLTDEKFFKGHLDDMRQVRAAVTLPVLRKDFVLSPYQLVEARAAGADAALLIVAGLASPLSDPDVSRSAEAGPADLRVAFERLKSLLGVAREIGLDCLVEVHDEAELDVAIEAGAEVIGINNRNLATFETTIAVTERLGSRVPERATLVSESGITEREEVQRVRRAGAHAILVGSSIVSAPDPTAKIRELIS
jgi:indole-3-glycerol phosphate synthase